MSIVLFVGVAAYFLIRIYLWFKTREFIHKESISPKRIIFFLGIDLCIILLTILQIKFPQVGLMAVGGYYFVIKVSGLSLFLAGVFLSSWARLTLGTNWRPASCYNSNYQQNLVTWGPYAFSRHPIYTGMILMGLGFELSLGNWLFLGIIPAVFLIYRQAILEEELLQRIFPQYEQYRMKTKMFLPKFF